MKLNDERVDLPKEWAPAGTFLLKYHGDHLQDAHIVGGDYVLVHPQRTAAAGDIVVTLDGDEVAVQRYSSEVVNIIGRVAGVLRVMSERA